MRHVLSAAAAVAVIILGGTAISPNLTSAEVTAVTSCSALDPGNPGCCACNGEPPEVTCIQVAHNGVASCTFEFCSGTNCTTQVE